MNMLLLVNTCKTNQTKVREFPEHSVNKILFGILERCSIGFGNNYLMRWVTRKRPHGQTVRVKHGGFVNRLRLGFRVVCLHPGVHVFDDDIGCCDIGRLRCSANSLHGIIGQREMHDLNRIRRSIQSLAQLVGLELELNLYGTRLGLELDGIPILVRCKERNVVEEGVFGSVDVLILRVGALVEGFHVGVVVVLLAFGGDWSNYQLGIVGNGIGFLERRSHLDRLVGIIVDALGIRLLLLFCLFILGIRSDFSISYCSLLRFIVHLSDGKHARHDLTVFTISSCLGRIGSFGRRFLFRQLNSGFLIGIALTFRQIRHLVQSLFRHLILSLL